MLDRALGCYIFNLVNSDGPPGVASIFVGLGDPFEHPQPMVT